MVCHLRVSRRLWGFMVKEWRGVPGVEWWISSAVGARSGSAKRLRGLDG